MEGLRFDSPILQRLATGESQARVISHVLHFFIIVPLLECEIRPLPASHWYRFAQPILRGLSSECGGQRNSVHRARISRPPLTLGNLRRSRRRSDFAAIHRDRTPTDPGPCPLRAVSARWRSL